MSHQDDGISDSGGFWASARERLASARTICLASRTSSWAGVRAVFLFSITRYLFLFLGFDSLLRFIRTALCKPAQLLQRPRFSSIEACWPFEPPLPPRWLSGRACASI